MQRTSHIRSARHSQLAREARRYGLSIISAPQRVIVSRSLMADGLPSWPSRLMVAIERSAQYHADRA